MTESGSGAESTVSPPLSRWGPSWHQTPGRDHPGGAHNINDGCVGFSSGSAPAETQLVQEIDAMLDAHK